MVLAEKHPRAQRVIIEWLRMKSEYAARLSKVAKASGPAGFNGTTAEAYMEVSNWCHIISEELESKSLADLEVERMAMNNR